MRGALLVPYKDAYTASYALFYTIPHVSPRFCSPFAAYNRY